MKCHFFGSQCRFRGAFDKVNPICQFSYPRHFAILYKVETWLQHRWGKAPVEAPGQRRDCSESSRTGRRELRRTTSPRQCTHLSSGEEDSPCPATIHQHWVQQICNKSPLWFLFKTLIQSKYGIWVKIVDLIKDPIDLLVNLIVIVIVCSVNSENSENSLGSVKCGATSISDGIFRYQ